MNTKMYKINQSFARRNKLPRYFVANKLTETTKAVYLYGHGTLESQKTNECCYCGRALTHPVSVLLGIGPECGGHFWDWNRVGGFENATTQMDALKLKIKDFKIDTWMPKYVISEVFDCEEKITNPPDHPILKRNNGTVNSTPQQKTAKKVRYQDSGIDAIKIEFPFDRTDLTNIKTLPGRRFHNEGTAKYWTCPMSIEAITKLDNWNFKLDNDLKSVLEHSKKTEEKLTSNKGLEPLMNIEGLKKPLYPYQGTGVSFFEMTNGRGLLADEMGLGKTIQALAWLQLRPEKRPVVIVVPSFLKLNWVKEAYDWMSKPNVQTLNGQNPNVPIIGEIIIINYDILPFWVDALKGINPKVLILDECHYIKNNKAKRTKAVKKLAKGIPHIISMSGTPFENRPIEIYNAINLVNPTVFPHFMKFAEKFCDAKHNGYGWDFTGASNQKELHDVLTKTIMLRRLKKDVLKDLPAKQIVHVPMELDNYKDYKSAENDFIEFVRQLKGNETAARASSAQQLAEIEGLKQLAVQGKLKDSINWIQDFLETGKKLVVFAVHKFVIDALMNEFGNIAVKVDGSMTTVQKNAAVEAFQGQNKSFNPQLFIGNIKAAGVGITLTAASDVFVMELPWTPGALQQAIDRVHRISQDNAVTAYMPLAADSIEFKIAHLLDFKKKNFDSIMDGQATEETSILNLLVESYSS